MIDKLRYCNRCVMPETNEGMAFDENGICRACASSEQKMHINWATRRNALDEIIETAKEKAKQKANLFVRKHITRCRHVRNGGCNDIGTEY